LAVLIGNRPQLDTFATGPGTTPGPGVSGLKTTI